MAKKEPTRVPLVALVGRPNVGKSTLFNRLVGERKSLVDDQPGVTRDRIFGQMEWAGHVWRLVDTGGFEPKTDVDILRAMRRQTEYAIAEADLVVFLTDGREGVTPSDHEVSDILRKSGKPVVYAINKIDGARQEDNAAEFYELGIDNLLCISAEHGYRIDELLDVIAELVPGTDAASLEAEDFQVIPRVAVLGKPNVGKSTLINALAGEDRVLVHHEPGTTRDTIDLTVRLGGQEYVFVDTAGLRRKKKVEEKLERFAASRAVGSLARCHLAVVVMDAIEGIVDQDAKIASLAHEAGRAVILVFNKWDLVENKEARRHELDQMVSDRLPHVDYAPILTISALEGLRTGKLPVVLASVWEQYNRRITTGELNRSLERWTTANPPPAPAGRPIKIHYATQSNVRPPSFVLFTTKPEKVPTSYERYLINQVRADYGFAGSPLRVIFRARKKKPG